uniref:helicase-related protein n=1 Tax=Eshraghiella crossota TaxID=45851 RepID=UPI004028AB0C
LYFKSLQNILKSRGNADAIEGLGMELRRDLDPLFIRRMKKDVAKSLPQKAVSKVKEIMPPVQKQAYESIIARARLAKRTKGKINPLQIINDLRTSSLFPNLDRMNEGLFLNLSAEDFFMSSARLKRMLYILYAIKRRNEKVIIFVTLRLMQQKLRRELSKLFQIYIPVAINGTVEAESRQKIVDEFNSAQGFQILILSPEAAGVGLNITGANNVIHLSRSWNPAKEDQATDRVYRIGQKRDVNVYIPIAYDSALGEGECFDEKLDKLLDFKRSLSDVALFPSVETQKDQEYLLGCVFNHEDGPQSISSAESWDMDELDRVNEKTFKSISAKLLRNLGYDVSVANRRGVDLKADRSNGEVLLVRCAQCIYPDKFNIEDIIGIADAVKRKSDIGALVITNSTSIDQHITNYARKMDVQIWNRQTLENLLNMHPVLK